MKSLLVQISVAAFVIFLMGTVNISSANRRPAPPPSRYAYSFQVDAKSLPKGVSVRTATIGTTTRHFIKNQSDIPLIINERFHLKRLVAGTKLVSGESLFLFSKRRPHARETPFERLAGSVWRDQRNRFNAAERAHENLRRTKTGTPKNVASKRKRNYPRKL